MCSMVDIKKETDWCSFFKINQITVYKINTLHEGWYCTQNTAKCIGTLKINANLPPLYQAREWGVWQ